ncbi:MAG: putative portal protein [Prokaryotic dsDNA virus sp.]|nr:MAG: putative portal protein [Prokaryotic dsDNA virus sp.]|tara:strand:+ start:746 stop:2851 length:2106 start_codon:yes stop_codon:yes gene_type:complete
MSDFYQLGKGHQYTDDTEVIKQGDDFVSYGRNNDYPDFLIDLYQKSAVHNALCNSISTWVYGDGITSPQINSKSESWAKFKLLFEQGVGKNTIQKCILDLKVHGGFYLSISYSIDRTTISEVNHMPFECMRVQPEIEGDYSDFYLYSKNWKNYKRLGYSKIKAFDPKMKKEYPNQIACFKMYSVGQYYYPKPDYQGGINYIELDKNVSEFHLANIKNGLAPSFMINFNNGIPSEEKRRAVKDSIENELSGASNAGKFIVSFSDDRNNSPEITVMPQSDADKQYEFLSKEITSKLMISHRVVSPRLFGVNSDGGGLGNNADELRTASILFEDTVVNNYRDILLKAMELIMAEAGQPLQLEFVSKQPFQTEDDVKRDVEEIEASKHNLKSLQDIDTKPTKGMVQEAKKGLEWRREYGRGGTEIGVARARDISNGKNMSIDTIKRMYSFFSRHEKSSKQGKGFDIGEDGFPSAGRIAWALWGGDAGFSWSAKKVNEIESVQNLGQEIDMEEEDEKAWLEYLKDRGEKLDEEWELLEETEVLDAEAEAQVHNEPTKLFKRYANPDDKSKVDKGLYKIRYRYSKNISKNSRLFCKNMVANAKNGVTYRFEDIKEMGDDGINKEFAERGKSKYSIWLYKGGCFCHHKWIRQVWFRKRDKGRFLPNKGLDNDIDVTNQEPKGEGLRNAKGWKKANTTTNDMPNRGKIN